MELPRKLIFSFSLTILKLKLILSSSKQKKFSFWATIIFQINTYECLLMKVKITKLQWK